MDEFDKEFTLEIRKCGTCKHFRKEICSIKLGTCCKKLMGILSDMHVTYRAKEGACFEDDLPRATELQKSLSKEERNTFLNGDWSKS